MNHAQLAHLPKLCRHLRFLKIMLSPGTFGFEIFLIMANATLYEFAMFRKCFREAIVAGYLL